MVESRITNTNTQNNNNSNANTMRQLSGSSTQSIFCLSVILLLSLISSNDSFLISSSTIQQGHKSLFLQPQYGFLPSKSSSSVSLIRLNLAAANSNNRRKIIETSDDELKRQLTEYLQKRKECNADELAEKEKGKVIGGTKGNAILEYVSGAPVKEQIIDRKPNVFDYDELTKYGYAHLVTPIMDLKGGRRALYDLMGMDPPILTGPPPKKTAPQLIIDRTGAEDKARYAGLKMGQVLDDDVMAEALARANERVKQGKELRPKLMEEKYIPPFAGVLSSRCRYLVGWFVSTFDPRCFV
jgi:hypothetical protein